MRLLMQYSQWLMIDLFLVLEWPVCMINNIQAWYYTTFSGTRHSNTDDKLQTDYMFEKYYWIVNSLKFNWYLFLEYHKSRLFILDFVSQNYVSIAAQLYWRCHLMLSNIISGTWHNPSAHMSQVLVAHATIHLAL